MNYKHGAYGDINRMQTRETLQTKCLPIYVGTAPVQTVAGGKASINKPILIKNMASAKALFGYSEDWNKYTLCEAMHAHFVDAGIGPIILINAFDPYKHKGAELVTKSLTPTNSSIVIENAEDIIIDTVEVTGKVLNTDYRISYNADSKSIVIQEVNKAGLGALAIAVKYYSTDVSKLTNAEVAGSFDGAGVNTGVYAVADAYELCKSLPYVILAPGFSHVAEVHKAMEDMSQGLNGHWNIMLYSDIPLSDNGQETTLKTAKDWKNSHRHNKDNEKVFFPMWEAGEGRKYHLSVLYMLNKQMIDGNNDNIPYQSASNTEIIIPGKLYFGEGKTIVASDQVINENLNRNGISSAIFIGGRWVLWGAHTASYSFENATSYNIAETNIQMLQYICNDFQERRAVEIDKIIEKNRLQQIVAEEQARLDAMVSTGALLYGKAVYAGQDTGSGDLMQGDFNFEFNITTYQLSKSLSAHISYTKEGLKTLYKEGE